MSTPSYFLVALSNRENLELCLKYSLAGFPSSAGGAWTFCEIKEGDFLSFLYGARAYNLYQVESKEALRCAEKLPPWKPMISKLSQKSYSFPFRVHLKPVRIFKEPIVRAEFSYVAENLLLRGGYRKTHFQADQTTLQNVSQMGTLYSGKVEHLVMPEHEPYDLAFTRKKEFLKSSETLRFDERVLQTALRRHLEETGNLATLFDALGVEHRDTASLEVLGEKALPQGYIDLLVKDRVPLGSGERIPIEVKSGPATVADARQLQEYLKEMNGECPFGILIASDFGKKLPTNLPKNMKLVRYELAVDLAQRAASFDEIQRHLKLRVVTR